MLFLLKRTVPGALGGLLVLAALGLALRSYSGRPVPPLDFSPAAIGAGALVCAAMLVSDGLVHATLCLLGGPWYLRRYAELAGLFRGQSGAAILAGAALAGCGEELVFRGLGTGPAYLVPAAVAFGLLHHVRRTLWPFTLWSIWEGLLLAAGLLALGNLAAVMVGHFLHDVVGFLVFRHVNARPAVAPTVAGEDDLRK